MELITGWVVKIWFRWRFFDDEIMCIYNVFDLCKFDCCIFFFFLFFFIKRNKWDRSSESHLHRSSAKSWNEQLSASENLLTRIAACWLLNLFVNVVFNGIVLSYITKLFVVIRTAKLRKWVFICIQALQKSILRKITYLVMFT